jgi:nucleotide-binding universal stress UspA family protein
MTVEAALAMTSTAARPILLGTDFGPTSAAAERAAIALAAERRTELVVVHAIDPGRLRLPGGLWRERVDQARAARERDAAVLVGAARAAGVSARVLIWTGDAATCVLDAAHAEGAERIVLGSHGRGRLGKAIAGSVVERVVGQSDLPVDVVRPAHD